MAVFKYRAISKDGKINSSEIEAASLNEAKNKIKEMNLTPIEITQGKTKQDFSLDFSAFGRLKFRKKKSLLKVDVLSHFCRQLSVIMDSGINTIKGLQVLKMQTPDKRTQDEIERLINGVKRGLTISEAMDEPGSLFPSILTGVVRAGESTGKIDIVLRSMADYYEKENLLGKKVKSAAVYPMIVLAMAFVLVIFFVQFLMPMVINIVESSGGKLFLITKIVIGISTLMGSYYYIIIPFLILGILGIKNFFSRDKGKRILDRIILKVPMLGTTRKNIISLRFAMAMYVFTISGFSILQGLVLLKSIVGSPLAEDSIDTAIKGLQRGESISENFKRDQFFDDILVQMISIGEETGQMQKLTEKLVDYYDKEVELGINKLISLAEPVLMLVIGVIVGLLIISVALPMMTIFTNV